MATILKIKINKAGTHLDVDTGRFSEEVYAHIFVKGLEPLLNARMSKIHVKDLEGEELAAAQADALKIAEENLNNLYEGKITRGRAAAKTKDGKKVDREVMTEARRLAKEIIKDEIRAAGKKPSHFEPSEITKAANSLLEADDSIIEKAMANIAARKEVKTAHNLVGMLHESPKLLAKANERKLERKATLSATQAGRPKVTPRKGQQAAH